MMSTTFHNDPELKAKILARIAVHEAADSIKQGEYARQWEGAGGFDVYSYCTIGCVLRDFGDTDRPPEGSGWHLEANDRLGWSRTLATLVDYIHEALDWDEAVRWPRRVVEAIPVGTNTSDVDSDDYFHQLANELRIGNKSAKRISCELVNYLRGLKSNAT